MRWDINPLHWGRSNMPMRRQQEAMMPLFDRFFNDFLSQDFPSMQSLNEMFVPSIDLTETDKEVRISFELPGLEDEDIDLNLNNNILTVKGEKKAEEETRDGGIYRSERRYGSFSRSVELPPGLDLERVEAQFKNGVLCVKFPKTAEYAQKVRSIPIGKGEEKQTSS